MIIEDELLKQKIQKATDEFNGGQTKINSIAVQQDNLNKEIEKIKEMMITARGKILVCQELLTAEMRGPQESVNLENKGGK